MGCSTIRLRFVHMYLNTGSSFLSSRVVKRRSLTGISNFGTFFHFFKRFFFSYLSNKTFETSCLWSLLAPLERGSSLLEWRKWSEAVSLGRILSKKWWIANVPLAFTVLCCEMLRDGGTIPLFFTGLVIILFE